MWRLAVVGAVQAQGPRQYLRLVFATKDFTVDVGGAQMSLAEWIDRSGLTYVGWDPDAADIVVFDFAPLAGQLKPSFDGPFHNQVTPHALLGSAASTAKKTAAKKTVAKATAARRHPQEDDGEGDGGQEGTRRRRRRRRRGEEDDGEEGRWGPVTSQLVGSDYTDGAQLPNYVNGRLLVAEDLATGQATLRTRDQWIGQAAGAGIVRGLWVTGSGTTLTVDPGLAVSAAGEPVVVPHAVTLELAAAATPGPTAGPSFQCCDSSRGQPAGTVPGSVLLVARSACQLQGQAPLAPPPSTTVSPGCTAQWLVEGVEFRTIPLPVADTVAGQQVTAGNRRNLVAHWCFGTEQLAKLGANPFAFDPAYRGIDLLDPADLTPYDVPLAVFTWTGKTVADLDNWSARRRVTAPDPTPGHWSVEVTDRPRGRRPGEMAAVPGPARGPDLGRPDHRVRRRALRAPAAGRLPAAEQLRSAAVRRRRAGPARHRGDERGAAPPPDSDARGPVGRDRRDRRACPGRAADAGPDRRCSSCRTTSRTCSPAPRSPRPVASRRRPSSAPRCARAGSSAGTSPTWRCGSRGASAPVAVPTDPASAAKIAPLHLLHGPGEHPRSARHPRPRAAPGRDDRGERRDTAAHTAPTSCSSPTSSGPPAPPPYRSGCRSCRRCRT